MHKVHVQVITAKAFTIYIRYFSLLRKQQQSANIKLTLHTWPAAAWGSMKHATSLHFNVVHEMDLEIAPVSMLS